MIPNATRASFSPTTTTLVFGSLMLRRTRAGVQRQGSPCSIASRDMCAMPAASASVAKRMATSAIIRGPSSVGLGRGLDAHFLELRGHPRGAGHLLLRAAFHHVRLARCAALA